MFRYVYMDAAEIKLQVNSGRNSNRFGVLQPFWLRHVRN